MTRMSGFCSPAPGGRHEYGHEACQKHIKLGNVARCDCQEYGGHEPSTRPVQTTDTGEA